MSQQPRSKQTRILGGGMPDQTVHQPPSAMTALGGLGVLAGIGGNGWQMYTTIAGIWQMFTGKATPSLDLSNVIFDVCFLIAFSFQFALLYLVFRIDTRWKRQQTGSLGKKKRTARGYGYAAVEVVQQLGLFGIWVGVAFVIDTLGDYLFISSKVPANTDPTTTAFLIFLYAVSLYALSTIAFVRAWEYLWAARAVNDQWQEARERRRHDLLKY